MPIQSIHTYLVYPGKGAEQIDAINGSEVPLQGKLFSLLEDVYSRSEIECTIDIAFNQGQDGTQANLCRTLLIEHLSNRTMDTGRALAERLAHHTTKRSGLGLLFLIAGEDGNNRKIVISRFPAQSAVMAEAEAATLNLAFLERVFMKKRVLLQGRGLPAHFVDQRLLGGARGRQADRKPRTRSLAVLDQ